MKMKGCNVSFTSLEAISPGMKMVQWERNGRSGLWLPTHQFKAACADEASPILSIRSTQFDQYWRYHYIHTGKFIFTRRKTTKLKFLTPIIEHLLYCDPLLLYLTLHKTELISLPYISSHGITDSFSQINKLPNVRYTDYKTDSCFHKWN